jgi:GNAT superfamily N-acetyltransferase
MMTPYPTYSVANAIQGLDDNLIEYVKLYQTLDQAEYYEGSDMIRLCCRNLPNAFFNSVVRLRLADVPAQVNAALDLYEDACLPTMWWLDQAVQPANLADYLQQRGFRGEIMPSMALDLTRLASSAPPVPLHFRLTRVTDDAALQTWCRVNSMPYHFMDYINAAFFQCYQRQGYAPEGALHHYLGWLEDEPVACSSLFLSAGVAAIYSLATLHQAQRRGIGTAMTYYPLRFAYTRGYRIGVLTATPEGYPMYTRLGFQEICQTSMWTY